MKALLLIVTSFSVLALGDDWNPDWGDWNDGNDWADSSWSHDEDPQTWGDGCGDNCYGDLETGPSNHVGYGPGGPTGPGRHLTEDGPGKPDGHDKDKKQHRPPVAVALAGFYATELQGFLTIGPQTTYAPTSAPTQSPTHIDILQSVSRIVDSPPPPPPELALSLIPVASTGVLCVDADNHCSWKQRVNLGGNFFQLPGQSHH